ncbi:hypothetical protein AB3662_11370 [Sorangium cellulosum]|uniref:hypothetical protein n=1 Tax=Sorangium cellulosum TaxID=56 RepID=UPI003D9A0D25
MGSDLESSPFHRQLLAALDGLRGLALADLEPAALLVALTVVGDALRLGVEVPGPVMRAAEALPNDAFRAAFLALYEETATWALPVEPDTTGDLPDFAWAVRRRDEAESVIVAARRVLVPRGMLLEELEEVRAFDAFLMLSDFTCGRRLGRTDAERAMGERVLLARPGSWVEALPDLERAEERIAEAEKTTSEPLPFAIPSDASVDAYVTQGRLAAWIEGAARRSPAFAEELEAMIDASFAAGATVVSLRALRWLSGRPGRSRASKPGAASAKRASVRIAAVPPAALAAADRDEALVAPQRTVHFGALDPLDIEASLTVSVETATLQLFPARGLDLASVQLGSAVIHAPDAEGIWRVKVPTTDQPLDLRVQACDGRVFEETIELGPEG